MFIIVNSRLGSVLQNELYQLFIFGCDGKEKRKEIWW